MTDPVDALLARQRVGLEAQLEEAQALVESTRHHYAVALESLADAVESLLVRMGAELPEIDRDELRGLVARARHVLKP